MAKGVFTARIGSAYDDVLEERYHFPRAYLRRVEAVVGDWIVYYEPRRTAAGVASVGRQAYFAMARVDRIFEDSTLADHFYAHMSGYLDFRRATPFRAADGSYLEAALRRADGETNKGAFGHAVRIIPEYEFNAILSLGFAESLLDEEREASPRWDAPFGEIAPTVAPYGGLADDGVPFIRPIIERIVARPFRDLAFRRQIQDAYDKTCAVTGLRLINGGGRPEVQAAHIQAVAANGPDSVRNGLALSGTVHWLFDRGHITIDAGYRLVAPERLIPTELRPLVRDGARLKLPKDQAFWPHQKFLDHHRQTTFKG